MAANSAIFRIPQETTLALDGQRETAELETVVRLHARFVFKVAYGVLAQCRTTPRTLPRKSSSACTATALAACATCKPGWRPSLSVSRLTVAAVPKLSTSPKSILPASDISAEQSAIERQSLERVHRLIASLPDDLRYPLVLSAIEELNSRQIAAILGIPESSVRGRIMRARQLLKEKLAAISEVKP